MLIPLLLLSLGAADQCRPARANATAASIIDRSINTLGLNSLSDRVRIAQSSATIVENGQSDRPYPPYFLTSGTVKTSFSWNDGILKSQSGRGFAEISSDTRRVLAGNDTSAFEDYRSSRASNERSMDPWAVLSDWRRDTHVKVAGECMYRDYWRTVLERNTSGVAERLFIDSKSAFPLKLDRREPHYLLGDVTVSYIWSLWTPIDSAYAAGAVFRMINGTTVETRMTDHQSLQPRDSAARIPDRVSKAPATLADPIPDTARLSATTFALITPSYTNVVSLQRDTVFILDAQTSESRARHDSTWIATLFPGRHPYVLVVSDVAWPHIGGVRFWVARGASVVTHRASIAFLQDVLNRKWTLAPDALQSSPAGRARLKIRSVDNKMTLANGAVEVRPIDGADSESALMVYLPNEKTLYAADYVQSSAPERFSTTYARELAAAVERERFDPQRFVAMHIRPRPWSDITRFTGRQPLAR